METKDIVQYAGLLVALLGLGWSAYSVHLNRKTKQAELWLALRRDFTRFEDVHLNLRPGGDWNPKKSDPESKKELGPETTEEWGKVEAYMGLFEHCESMLKQGLLNEQVFVESFKYRVKNLYANPVIRKTKLVRLAAGWTRFLDLGKRLGLPDPSQTA